MGEYEVMVQVRLDELMKERKLTQQEVATQAGIPQSTVSRWSNNFLTSYDREVIEKLLAFFEIELTDLFVVTRKKKK